MAAHSCPVSTWEEVETEDDKLKGSPCCAGHWGSGEQTGMAPKMGSSLQFHQLQSLALCILGDAKHMIPTLCTLYGPQVHQDPFCVMLVQLWHQGMKGKGYLSYCSVKSWSQGGADTPEIT